ncbi:RNA 2',3'-cyclic phosphodiesterase [Telmatocola sphagniphila]|uniref:RNA 2',3'-cyclic phosphodiesterase n=1 Tax=Telmatocola sphagniphila TaxID=1123043 RepID=A0A8E6B2H7_9BACT|nr:RNA 2',3'-cyclic phosphodiesterase [Telmatocola sphagniphila]QVL30194.1 RNA 2',3'-cyclic phosphodiesterase [Telmatocola sphagniphila]
MARLRTFIAVELSERIRSACLDLQLSLTLPGAPVKWVSEDNFHITLLFLGEVNELDLVAICRSTQKSLAKQKSFQITVGGLGCFPTPRRPKVLWAGVSEGQEQLAKLHAKLEAPLMEIGCYRREERNYTPHLTLGRIEPVEAETEAPRITGEKAEEISWPQIIRDHEEWKAGYCDVNEVLVMTSELRRSGPVYSVVARTPLG